MGCLLRVFLKIPWWPHQTEKFPRYWPFVRGIHRSTVNSHDHPHYWFILDPKSKQDKVKSTNWKNLSKLQNCEFWKHLYMGHTFGSCLIRRVNIKWIWQVLWKIQNGQDSVHRWTEGQGETSMPPSTSLSWAYNDIIILIFFGFIDIVQACNMNVNQWHKYILRNLFKCCRQIFNTDLCKHHRDLGMSTTYCIQILVISHFYITAVLLEIHDNYQQAEAYLRYGPINSWITGYLFSYFSLYM